MKKRSLIKSNTFQQNVNGWAAQMSDFVKEAGKKGKPVVIGDLMFGHPFNGVDQNKLHEFLLSHPNGLHEFFVRLNKLDNLRKIKPKCIHCGKNRNEVEKDEN